MSNKDIIPANAICYKCGTAEENAKTGFCKNGHDNWLESNDDLLRLARAAKKFGISVEQLDKNIKGSISINNFNTAHPAKS